MDHFDLHLLVQIHKGRFGSRCFQNDLGMSRAHILYIHLHLFLYLLCTWYQEDMDNK